MRSTKNFLAAGFTSKSWRSADPELVEDESAMVFALTGKLQVFKTHNPSEAVGLSKDFGPYFLYALALSGTPMNHEHYGLCNTMDMVDLGDYQVPADEEERSPLTGSKHLNQKP